MTNPMFKIVGITRHCMCHVIEMIQYIPAGRKHVCRK